MKKVPKLPDLPVQESFSGRENLPKLPDLPKVPVDSDGGAYLDSAVLASLLRDRRQELGLSQEALADYVHGLDRTTVANWEAGLNLAGHVILLRALDVLGIELRRIPAHCLKSNNGVSPSP